MASYPERLRKLHPRGQQKSLCFATVDVPEGTAHPNEQRMQKASCWKWERRELAHSEHLCGRGRTPSGSGDAAWAPCQISEARGGGAELDSERWCRCVTHGARRYLHLARPTPGPGDRTLRTRFLACRSPRAALDAETPPADSGAPEAPWHRRC